MKQILTLFLLATLLSNCKKSSTDDNYYTINGIVADFDNRTVIAGAKVYVRESFNNTDSAISNASGRVSFTFKKDSKLRNLYATKAGYLYPLTYFVANTSNTTRTDSIFLARPSFVDLTVHNAGAYLLTDSVSIQVIGAYMEPYGMSNSYQPLLRDKAVAADKLFNLKTVYQKDTGVFTLVYGVEKLYFQADIIRGGAVISTKADSTTLIQFGTKNFTLNY